MLANHAPVGSDATLTAIEDTAYTFTTANFGFSDPDDTSPNTLLAVKISGLPLIGVLADNGVAVTAGQFIPVADITGGKLKFTPAANGNGTGYANFTFQVQDNGGTASGGVDLDQSPNTITFNVTAVNDAPAGTNATVTTLEDTVYTFTAADFGFTDPNDSPANNLLAVKITAKPSIGTLANNGVTIANGNVVTIANINAGLLKYTPVANAKGAPHTTFTFQVQDDGGTANSGVDLDASANTITVNVTSVNDAPAGTNKTVTTLEDTAYTFTVADFGFTDTSDSPANALLAVKMSTLPVAGVLANNGVAVTAGQFVSLADISGGLLKFTPAANGNGTGYASFTFQVQDDGGTANGGVDLDQSPNTITVNVTSVNDAPSGADRTITALEDVAYTFTTTDFGFTDLSDSPANTLLAVKISALPLTGTLALSSVAVTVGQIVTAANITSGLLKFTAAANANGSGYASFTFQVQDNGGVTNGGVDLDASPNTITINVTSLNDAPAGTNATISTLEDTAYTFTAADFGFTDPNDSPPNALLAVRISALPTLGALANNGVAVTAGQVISAANINSGLLKYTPGANGNGTGYASFTFQVQDDGGTASGGVDLDASPNTITVNVTAVNDPPAGTNKTITTLEDTAYTFTAADFGFTDPSDSPANTLLAVKISTLPAAGVLADNGVAVTVGQFVSLADVTGGLLKFTPVANANGTGYASFTFQVQDSGGTANGGVDLDQSPNTITINVTSVNDEPAGTDKTITTLEDTAYTFTAADFGFTDLNDSPANTLLAVKISTLPLVGSLANNGVAVTAGQVITVANINSGLLKFTPVANANGAGYASFTFQVQDNGGVTSSGVDLDATPNTITVNVTSVNDAPAGTNKTITAVEDAVYTFTAADFGFTDPNDSPANALLAVKISTLPAAGALANNGVAVTAGQVITLASINAGLSKFTPAANANGASYASFTFQVQDDGGTANSGVDLDASPNTITVSVTAVNDAPAGTDKTITTLEDTAYTFTAADFGFTDTSDSPANTLLAVKISTLPAAGVLVDNGVAVTAGQFVNLADITGGLLKFTPAANSNGTGYASFTFQVQDNGGTANGGVDLDQSPNTITFNVTAVNDAPAGADKTVTTLEDTVYTFTAADFGFTDLNDSPANTLLAVKISTLPLIGALANNGVAVTVGQVITVANINSGLLKFTPVANGSGASYATFTFQVQDNGGTTNGGVDLDASPNTITVSVTSVNDAPGGTNKTITALEDTPYIFAAVDFGFTDTSDSPANALLAVKISTLPVAGVLANNGVAVTVGQFVSLADIASGLLVFTPGANSNGTSYASFTFQVQDNGGTANGGVDLDASPNTITFNVTAVNDAPAGTDKTITTLEDTTYTFTAADLGFTDTSDSPANTLLAVKISALPATGVLMDNGVAVTAGQFVSLADITGGLLKFTPAANGAGTGYASFTFQVQDNGGTANGGVDLDPSPNTITFNVTSVNDAPAGTNNTVTTLEDTAYTFTAVDFGFTDPNDSPANTLLAVKVSTLPAIGSLTNNGVAVTIGQVIAVASINSGLLKYTPVANANGASYASFTFQVQDNGGTTNGGVDLDASPNTITINVTAVNDAPAGADKTITTLEDTAYTFTAADFGFTDTSDSPANTLLAVKISTLPVAGVLTNNGVAVTAGQVVSLADITAGLFVFTPGGNSNGTGYASFTFQVQDNGGTANGGVDLDPSPNTVTINVTAVNDAPAGADKTITTLEDTVYTFTAADFGFTDPNDSPANTLLAVKISTLPLIGALANNGVAVTVGQFIAAANITSGLLKFTPVVNANGDGYASFTFQLQDNGGTANGGVDLDASPNAITINVTSVNDAPAGTNKTIATLEDTAYTLAAADFGFTDPNDTPTNALLTVKISTLAAAGILADNGVAVTAGQFVSLAEIAGGLLKFTPVANANGAGYASFTFQVQDSGGTANGGVDLDQSPNSITVNVTAVNDAPAGTNKTVTALEDTSYTFTAADFGFADPNDSPANTLTAVKISALPAAGVLTNNGVAVTAGQFVSLADITGGLLKFTPAANANGAGYASFTFQVQDNGGTANGGVDLDQSPNTITINITSVNDAPNGADKTITTLEDTAYTFTAADFGSTDPNDSPANALLAVKISTLPLVGGLSLNGVAVTAGQVITVASINAGSLKFAPAANANGAPYGTFTFQVQDDGGASNGGVDLDSSPNTITINVTSVNDAPAGTNKTITTLEDTAYTFTAADFGFTDPNDSPANTIAAVKISTLPAAGILTNDGVPVISGQFVSVADIIGGLLKFIPGANDAGAGYSSFMFQIQDNGGTANGGVDLDQSPNSITIDVTSVNDEPAGADNTVVTLEDTTYTFTAADFGFTDPNDSPANNLQAVMIASLPVTGLLTNNGVAVMAGQLIALSDIDAGLLQFTPDSNANGAGYASFTFQVQDDGGTADGGIDLDASPKTITINVPSVNDEPAGADNTVVTLEDTTYTFTAADFGFTDSHDSPANNLQAVMIASLPVVGALSNNGSAVSAGQSISLADIDAGLLQFTPDANANGVGYASFSFQVQDDGGTADGGVDLDPSPKTMTIDVTSVNDEPAGADNTVITLEDTTYTFTAADFGFTDTNDSPANNLLAVVISTLPTAGSLTINGSAVTAGQTIALSDIDAGLLQFTPDPNAKGAGYASFTFQVQDDGGTADGGVDLDTSPKTITIDVTSVNDEPAGADNTVVTLEDTTYTFTAADFGFADLHDSPANNLQAVMIATLPVAGVLTYNGVVVSAGQLIALSDIDAGLLHFTPDSNANGAGYASFTFQVQDDGGTAAGGVNLDPSPKTMTVDVTSVNDEPAGADNTVVTLEDTAYTFTAADFGFTDTNDSPANNLLAVVISTLPTAGSLTNSGVAVTAGQLISLVDIESGLLQFTPDPNANGVAYASFTFQVQDDRGTADGGMDLDASPKTITIDVVSVNDEPAGTDMTVLMLENTVYTFTAADFALNDLNDSPANSLHAVKFTTLPTLGALTNHGVAVTAGQFVSLADIAAGLLKFKPAAMGYGTEYATFTFQVQDDGGTADGGVDLDASSRAATINVTEVLAAEIDLRGGGVSIVAGDTAPSLADDTDFGSQDIIAGTVIHTLGIVNLGNIPLDLTGAPLVQITGVNASDFTVTYLPTSSIVAGGYTYFQITFDPSALGLRTATVAIANSDSDESLFHFDIQGTGIVAPPAAEINVRGGGMTIVDGDTTPSLADDTDFGDKDVLAGKAIHAFGVVNLGNIALQLTGAPLVQITGADASDFVVTYLPTSSIAVGGYTFFQITFDPSATGLRTATVTIANNDNHEGLFQFDVEGTGIVAPPAAEINLRGGGFTIVDGDTTPSLADDTDFGSKDVLAGRVIHAFGIVNLGNIALNLTGAPLVQITGANATDFTVTYLPTSSIAVGGYTFFQITFDPTAAGLRTALVTITNNDSDEGQFQFEIQGTGIVAPPAAEINVRGGGFTIVDGDITPSLTDATDFGSRDVTTGRTIRAFGIVNLGNIPLELTSTELVQITGANASDFKVTYSPRASIAVGSYTFFQITFDPSAIGLRKATVIIANNDNDEGLFQFDIQGMGTQVIVG